MNGGGDGRGGGRHGFIFSSFVVAGSTSVVLFNLRTSTRDVEALRMTKETKEVEDAMDSSSAPSLS